MTKRYPCALGRAIFVFGGAIDSKWPEIRFHRLQVVIWSATPNLKMRSFLDGGLFRQATRTATVPRKATLRLDKANPDGCSKKNGQAARN